MTFPLDACLQASFLLAFLQLQHVLRETGEGNMKRALETMPETTDDAFDKILKRIEANSGSSSRKTALRTLTWCYYAKRALKMEELREALVIEDGDNELRRNENSSTSIVECCLSFVTLDQLTGEVRFVHPSVQRWFEIEPHRKLLPPDYVAKACLTYLKFDVFDVPISESMRISPDKSALFYQYAARFWSDHTREVQQEPTIQAASLAFLEAEICRDLMLRTNARVQAEEYHGGHSSLHVAASRGLDALCHLLLAENMR